MNIYYRALMSASVKRIKQCCGEDAAGCADGQSSCVYYKRAQEGYISGTLAQEADKEE